MGISPSSTVAPVVPVQIQVPAVTVDNEPSEEIIRPVLKKKSKKKTNLGYKAADWDVSILTL